MMNPTDRPQVEGDTDDECTCDTGRCDCTEHHVDVGTVEWLERLFLLSWYVIMAAIAYVVISKYIRGS